MLIYSLVNDMEQTLTAKIRLFPTDEQEKSLLDTMRAYKQACNMVSDYSFEHNQRKRKELHNALYRDIRKECGLTAQMACSAIRTVIASYKSMEANGSNSKAVYKAPFYALVRGKDYTLKGNGYISIGSIDGRHVMKYTAYGVKDLFTSGCLGTAILKCKHGKFFLHVSVTVDVDDVDENDVCNVVGVDRGERFLATAYDSCGKTTFYDGKAVRARKQHYRRVRKSLMSKKTPSSRKRMAAIGSRENRWMRDVNHCVSKALVSAYDSPTLFFVEDLSGLADVIRKRDGKTRKERKTKDLLVSWAHADLLAKFKYKAAQAGHFVVETNPAYTSQTCPKCGHVDHSARNKWLHEYTCTVCGYRTNDDRIAAMNLHRKGIEYLVQCQPSMLALDGACCQ